MDNYTIDDLPTCSRSFSTLVVSAISFVSVASFFGNSLVTVTFLMDTKLRTRTNYFIVNMAISDLLSSLTNWPLSATEGFLSRKPMIEGSAATLVCKLGVYCRAISQAVSVLSLLLIVVDRYFAIVHPFRYVLVTRRSRVALLLFTWIIPLLFGFPYVWTGKLIQEGHKAECEAFISWKKIEQNAFHTAGFLTFYCVPLVSITVLYSRIMKRLRQSRPGEEGQESTRIRNLRQNRTVMKVFVWIVCAFFICWTPLCVYIVLRKVLPALFSAGDPCMLLPGLFFYVFPTLSTVINPIILFASSSRFFKALKVMFSCFTCNPSKCCRGGSISPEDVVMRMQPRNFEITLKNRSSSQDPLPVLTSFKAFV